MLGKRPFDTTELLALDTGQRLSGVQELAELQVLDARLALGQQLRHSSDCPILQRHLSSAPLSDAWPWLLKVLMQDAATLPRLPPSMLPAVRSAHHSDSGDTCLLSHQRGHGSFAV